MGESRGQDLHTQLAAEHSRLHLVGTWPDSPRKQALMQAIRQQQLDTLLTVLGGQVRKKASLEELLYQQDRSAVAAVRGEWDECLAAAREESLALRNYLVKEYPTTQWTNPYSHPGAAAMDLFSPEYVERLLARPKRLGRAAVCLESNKEKGCRDRRLCLTELKLSKRAEATAVGKVDVVPVLFEALCSDGCSYDYRFFRPAGKSSEEFIHLDVRGDVQDTTFIRTGLGGRNVRGWTYYMAVNVSILDSLQRVTRTGVAVARGQVSEDVFSTYSEAEGHIVAQTRVMLFQKLRDLDALSAVPGPHD